MKRARYAARDELRGAVLYDEAERPGRGLDLEEAVRRVIRSKSVARRPYLVVYAVFEDQLVVLAIAHTSKRPGYWRARIQK